ncbi:MAG: alpha/beta hydrolase [Actinomycetota bacterium]|nr:alpha/beta hydrolase [Actinomycetota bacterium]
MPERVEIQGDDVTLVLDAYGEKGAPGVLLAHGGGQTRHSWGGTARRLGESGYRTSTVDLRGHGDSSWSPDGRYDLADHAGDLRAVAEWMGAPPAFVGASLGGLSALVAIAEAPDQTAVASALVLVDVAIHLEPEGIARIGQFMRARPDGYASLEEVADAIAAYNPHRPRPPDLSGLRKNVRHGKDGRWRWHWDPRVMRDPRIDEPRTILHRQRLERDAASLRVPTLLVRGRNSDLLSEEGAKRFLDLVPEAELVAVDGAGHMVAGDRNDAFNDAIADFLRRIKPVDRETLER